MRIRTDRFSNHPQLPALARPIEPWRPPQPTRRVLAVPNFLETLPPKKVVTSDTDSDEYRDDPREEIGYPGRSRRR